MNIWSHIKHPKHQGEVNEHILCIWFSFRFIFFCSLNIQFFFYQPRTKHFIPCGLHERCVIKIWYDVIKIRNGRTKKKKAADTWYRHLFKIISLILCTRITLTNKREKKKKKSGNFDKCLTKLRYRIKTWAENVNAVILMEKCCFHFICMSWNPCANKCNCR